MRIYLSKNNFFVNVKKYLLNIIYLPNLKKKKYAYRKMET